MTQAVVEEIGVYGPGKAVSDADAERVVDQLKKMLDYWSTMTLSCFAILEQSKILVPGTRSYTIGAGGDINATRPLRIIDGPGAAYLLDSNNVRYPVNVVTQAEWNQISQLTNTSQIPSVLFYDPQYPLGIINVYPTPLINYTMYWDSYLQLNAGATLTLDSSISFPPGYEGGIQHNLAVWCGPFFKNALVSQDVKDLAFHTLKAIKRTNKRSNQAQFDREIVSRATPTFNIYRDNRTT